MERELQDGEEKREKQSSENNTSNQKSPYLDLSGLIPMGIEFLKNQQKNMEAQLGVEEKQLQFRKEQLKIEKSTFIHKYWLLAIIVFSIQGISIGLIFIKNNVAEGMTVLSHVGAVIVGIIAGSGWERSRKK